MAEITIASFQVPDLQFVGVETGELRLYASRAFLDSDGEVHLGGAEGNQEGFYQACPFTVTDGIITVDSFVTTSTLDAQDNAPSTILISGDLFGADGQFLQNLFSKWQIPTTTPTTFATLYNLNRSVYLPIAPDAYLTRAAVIDLIDTALGDRDYASDVVAGITYLSDAPDSATHPTAEGSNSTRLMSSLTYAALTALTAITGVIKFCSDRLKGLYYKTSAAIWCSLTGKASVLDHGCVGDGSTDCRSALNTLLNTTLATTGGVVYFPHYQNATNTDYLIGSGVTIPTNITLEVAPGARLKVATGVTVTCLAYIPLSPFQIFSLQGTGVVSFAGNRRLRELGGKWWGAVGDGSTDDTTPVQQALTAAGTLGTGKISFPIGIYLINGALQGTVGYQAKLLLPYAASGSVYMIEIVGASPPYPLFGTVTSNKTPSTNGTIFKTTSTTGGAMFGTGSSSFVGVGVAFRNILIRGTDDPKVTGIDARYCFALTTKGVVVDTPNYTLAQTQPSTSTVYGIRTPVVGNAGWTRLTETLVTGYYNGIEWSEHGHLDYCYVSSCINGYLIPTDGTAVQNDALSAGHIGAQNCTKVLSFDASAAVDIQEINIEHVDPLDGSVPAWQRTTSDLFESSAGFAHGTIRWHVVNENVGNADDFRVTAGFGGNVALRRIWNEGTAWTSYTPTVTSGTGTITTLGAVAAIYRKIGRTVYLRIGITITTNGTAATSIQATLPVNNAVFTTMTGQETGAGTLLKASSPDSGTAIVIKNYDGTYPGGDGKVLVINGVYEAA